MSRAELLDLISYTEWATGKLADALATVPDPLRRRRDESAFGSLLGTFAHLIAAEWIWLQRWQGTHPPAPPDWVGVAPFDELVRRLHDVERARRAWLTALDDDGLARPLAYRTFAGVEDRQPVSALVRHVVNHGTYHRGQISMRIRQLGFTPPSTDYIAWLRLPGHGTGAAPGTGSNP